MGGLLVNLPCTPFGSLSEKFSCIFSPPLLNLWPNIVSLSEDSESIVLKVVSSVGGIGLNLPPTEFFTAVKRRK